MRGEKKDNIPTLNSILNGTSITLIGKILSAVFGYINFVLIARILGLEQFGLYSFVTVVLSFGFIISNFGLEQTLLKLLSKSKVKNKNEFYKILYTSNFLVIMASLFVVTFLYLLGLILKLNLTNVDIFLYTMLWVVPFQSFVFYIRILNQSNYKYFWATFPELLLRPLLFFIFLISIYLLNYKISSLVIGAYVSSYIISFLASLISLIKNNQVSIIKLFNPFQFLSFGLSRDVIKLAPQFLFIILLNQASQFFIVIIMSLFLKSESIGFFRSAEQTAIIISFILTSINLVFLPIISTIISEKNIDKLEIVYKRVTKWTLSIGGFLCLILMINANYILSLFGDQYSNYGYILCILAIGQLVNSGTGCCGNILMMSSEQKKMIYIVLLKVLFVLCLGFIFVLKFKLIGAAISTSLGDILFNLLISFTVFKKMGVHPFSQEYFKVILVLLFGGAFIYIIGEFVNFGFLKVIVSTSLLGITVSILLYYSSLDAIEIKIINKILYKIRFMWRFAK